MPFYETRVCEFKLAHLSAAGVLQYAHAAGMRLDFRTVAVVVLGEIVRMSPADVATLFEVQGLEKTDHALLLKYSDPYVYVFGVAIAVDGLLQQVDLTTDVEGYTPSVDCIGERMLFEVGTLREVWALAHALRWLPRCARCKSRRAAMDNACVECIALIDAKLQRPLQETDTVTERRVGLHVFIACALLMRSVSLQFSTAWCAAHIASALPHLGNLLHHETYAVVVSTQRTLHALDGKDHWVDALLAVFYLDWPTDLVVFSLLGVLPWETRAYNLAVTPAGNVAQVMHRQIRAFKEFETLAGPSTARALFTHAFTHGVQHAPQTVKRRDTTLRTFASFSGPQRQATTDDIEDLLQQCGPPCLQRLLEKSDIDNHNERFWFAGFLKAAVATVASTTETQELEAVYKRHTPGSTGTLSDKRSQSPYGCAGTAKIGLCPLLNEQGDVDAARVACKRTIMPRTVHPIASPLAYLLVKHQGRGAQVKK